MGKVESQAVKDWHKICDFIAEHEIHFRECSDKFYRPDFRSFTPDPEKIDKMEKAYIRKWNAYAEEMRKYFA